jgi:hypothetical protein
MKHLTEDELIELFYAEGASAATTHLEGCRECSRKYAEFTRSMEEIRPVTVPQRSADYGELVWKTLRPRLIPYEKKPSGWHGWAGWRAAAMTVGCAMLLAAFLGGRYWERNTTKKANVTDHPQATQRVVLVVLGDHLDRTERLLVQVEHSQSPDTTENAQLQSEAQELLASNRLYRVSASNSGDAELAGALDRLEGVLAEIANNPNLTAADLKRVRKDMNTKGILFEIRVLQARSQDQGTKGASI